MKLLSLHVELAATEETEKDFSWSEAPSVVPRLTPPPPTLEGNASCVCVSSVMMAKEKPPFTVVGDVGGRIAIIVVRGLP